MGIENAVKVMTFSPRVDYLPVRCKFGDVIRFHRVVVGRHNGALQLLCQMGASFVVFAQDGTKVCGSLLMSSLHGRALLPSTCVACLPRSGRPAPPTPSMLTMPLCR